MPETPLRAIELSQRVAADPTICNSVCTLRQLLKIGEFHSDVEPIQHVFDVRRNLPVNCSQTGIAVRKKCNRSVFTDAALLERKTDRSLRRETSIPHKSKAGGVPLAVQRLPATISKLRSGW